MPTTSETVPEQRRRRWLVLAATTGVALVALVIAAMRDTTVRTFALDAPNQDQVALVRTGSQVCEGPLRSRKPIDVVGIWGASVIGPAEVKVEVRDAATGTALGSGTVRADTNANEYSAHLARTVVSSAPLRVCLAGRLNTFALLGSAAVHPNVVMTGARGKEFSLVLLDDRRSLAGWLTTAFARGSLFKAGWVGAWTFWVLAGGLLATFGLGVLATVRAAAADDRDEDGQIRASSQRTVDQ